MSGINDSLNWDLVKRQTVSRTYNPDGTFNRISPVTVVADSYVMMFGFRNDNAPSRWWYAATVSMKLLTLPSSTSEFMASVHAFSRKCGLRELSIIQFPNYGLLPFLAEIRFPSWHEQMYLEVWKYSGDEINVAMQTLERIETKIDAL